MAKKSRLSYIILIASVAVILSATVMTLWLTGAWFTDQKSNNSNITTATMSAEVKQSGNTLTTNDAITLTSGSLITSSNKITIKNSSTVGAYVRVAIVCNWEETYQAYESVFDVLEFTLGSNWSALTGSNANDKIKNNNYVYYNTALTANQEVDLITAVSIKAEKSMPDDAKLTVFVEVAQADNVGKTSFINSDPELTTLNWSTVIS